SFDVRAGKRLADRSRCDGFEGAPESGVQDVAFLPRGGMAYACGQLWLQSPAKGAVQLEPPGTNVTHLAVSKNSTESPLLYWTVVNGGTSTAKTLSLLR
ncbi:MAG: hypothetical protein KY463_12880, partial [Actinobacteria bacterium]|nr:hypothetical protein [Actinomycetota bacterium]